MRNQCNNETKKVSGSACATGVWNEGANVITCARANLMLAAGGGRFCCKEGEKKRKKKRKEKRKERNRGRKKKEKKERKTDKPPHTPLTIPMPKFIMHFLHKITFVKTNQNLNETIGCGVACTVSPGGASLVSTQCSTTKPAPAHHFCVNVKIHHMFHEQCPSVENEQKICFKDWL